MIKQLNYLLFILFSFFNLFILINSLFINYSSIENNLNQNINNNKRINELKYNLLKQNNKDKLINYGIKHYYVKRNKYYLNYGNFKKQKLIKLTAKNTEKCPKKIDAITEGYNKRLYLFSGEIVYEVWKDIHGLQQRQAYLIYELFPNGPRQVTAALINHRNGINLLIAWNRVYRYKWNKKNKKFYQTRKSPQLLPSNITFIPTLGFQWNKGHLILANKNKFIIYNPYLNIPTFISTKVNAYFQNLVIERLAGVVKYNQNSILWMTKEGNIQLYDLIKYKIGLEIPIDLSRFIACLT